MIFKIKVLKKQFTQWRLEIYIHLRAYTSINNFLEEIAKIIKNILMCVIKKYP